jgi:endonuclease YncB( thermonuclease family)
MRRLLTSCIRSICPCIKSTTNQTDDESFSDLMFEPKYDWKNTVPFIPPVTTGYVIKVYDGDTITIATKLSYEDSTVYRFPVRLNGIDSPEIHGKNDDEKEAAKISQKALESLILHQDVTLKNVKTEKYGRILADVYFGEINISEWMLENRYAVKYDGGTKQSPESWLKYQATGKI